MNKSQSLALVAVGVIAVLLVTAMVADPQDAMASKKHKKHHHHDGGASAAAAPQETLQLQQRVVADSLPRQQRQLVAQPRQQQPIRSAVVDSTKDKISFFYIEFNYTIGSTIQCSKVCFLIYSVCCPELTS